MDDNILLKNSSSMLELKALTLHKRELFRKNQLSQQQREIDHPNHLYDNKPSNHKFKLGKKIRDDAKKKAKKSEKEVQEEKDLEEEIELENALKRSREVLEKKTKLYEERYAQAR